MKLKDIPDPVWYALGAGVAYFFLKDQITAALNNLIGGNKSLPDVAAKSTTAKVGAITINKPVLATINAAIKDTDPGAAMMALPDSPTPSIDQSNQGPQFYGP